MSFLNLSWGLLEALLEYPFEKQQRPQQYSRILFQEKLAHFQAEGKVLSPDFKTNPMVEKVAKVYHSDVKKIWLACHENVDLVRQKSWFAKFVDLSKVDFSTMVSDLNEAIGNVQFYFIKVMYT